MRTQQVYQARIYVPGHLDKKVERKVERMGGVKEVRAGFCLPIPHDGVTLEPVWHVEFEDHNATDFLKNGLRSPKFFNNISKGIRIDEIVQSRTYPVGETFRYSSHVINGERVRRTQRRTFPKDNIIFTTSYLQNSTDYKKLTALKNKTGILRIYEGQHPIVGPNSNSRCDGHVVIADLEGLDKLVKLLSRHAQFGIITTRETERYAKKLGNGIVIRVKAE